MVIFTIMQQYLKNLKVVELAGVLAGPAVGMFFAELGAHVIKIENSKTGGDVTRKWKLPSEGVDDDLSAYFCSVNYKKEYLFYNLEDPAEREKVYNICAQADIVISNYKKGDDVKLGMDEASLRKVSTKMIYAHLSGYGENSNKPAFDVVLQAETGFMFMNGTAGSGPVKMPVALIDIMAAHQLKEAILLALLKRERTGKGSRIEVSLYESAIASLANQASNWLMKKHLPVREGSLHPNIAPYGEIMTTRDNVQLVLAIGSDKQFASMCECLGVAEIAKDEKFSTNQLRIKNREMLFTLLEEYFKKFDFVSLADKLDKMNVPYGRINNMEDLFSNEIARAMILQEDINGIDTKRVSTIAFSKKFLEDESNPA